MSKELAASGQLGAEQIEAKFEAWLRANCFQRPTQEAYELAKCAWKEMALSSLRGTFADGIEAAARVCQQYADECDSLGAPSARHASKICRDRIRALAQGQRPSEQDADELPVHVADALIHQIKSGESFDRSVMLIALGKLRAHLSRKEK